MLNCMIDEPNKDITTFKLASKVYKSQVDDNRKSIKKLHMISK